MGLSLLSEPGSGLRSFLIRDELVLWISISLLGAAGAAWVASYYLMPLMMGDMAITNGVAAIVSSSSISLSAIAFFEVVWVIGMAAMMFPAMIPVVLFYNRFATKIESNPSNARVIGTPLFLAGYLVTYLALGLGAYLAIFVALNLSSMVPWLASLSVVAAGTTNYDRCLPVLFIEIPLPVEMHLSSRFLCSAFEKRALRKPPDGLQPRILLRWMLLGVHACHARRRGNEHPRDGDSLRHHRS